jgi:peptide/nickel transport system substrate-binding protein
MNTKLWARVGAAATAAAVAVTLAACGSTSGGGSTAAPEGATNGTVNYLELAGIYDGTDPAAVYLGTEIAAFRRLVYRGLTALPISDDPNPSVVPDLATDTGTTTDGGLTWTYTIKEGAKWQDGSPVTADDFLYGLERAYDSQLSNGTGVGTTYLGQYAPSVDYAGPFTSTPEQQASFDSHFFVDGSTITYTFDLPWPDFPAAAAGLFTTDPYQESFDTGTAGLWTINSNGPYMLDGDSFDVAGVNTFVRNPEYDPATDSQDLRMALPDSFVFDFSTTEQDVLYQRFVADAGDDQSAFTTTSIPATFYSQITGPVLDRTLESTSPYTRFLQINSQTVTDPLVRRALVLATNKNGAIQAYGGEHYGTPTSTLVSSALPGFIENPVTAGDNPDGDPEAAAALLAEAGTPNPAITFAFADTPVLQGVAVVLQESWEAAGFVVTLNPIPTDATPGYYAQVSAKDKPFDVFTAGWAADWPSLFAAIPPILQSNPADATNGVGFNYGFFDNADVDGLIADATAAAGDPETQIKLLQEADAAAAEVGAYVPILNQKNWYIFGSKIGGFLPDAASSYYPDFGSIHVVG